MGKKQTAYRLAIDVPSNKIGVKLTGKVSQRDLEKLYTDIRFAVADLAPGFAVITDLLECTLASLDAITVMNKITNFLISNKVKVVIRIVEDKQFVAKQAINLGLRQQGLKIIYVSTKEEAENELKKASKRDGLRFHLLNHLVEYSNGDNEGNGILLDISTTGCAVKSTSILPELDDTISLVINFKPHSDLLEKFVCEAHVIWCLDDSFAVKFDVLDNRMADSLWDRLTYECE